MIESIIAEYMGRHRRLVIPGLGAFLKKENGETVFVPFLNKDDGILTGEVAKSYGISRAEAEAVVSQFTTGILNGIGLYGAYLAAPLGTLKKDPNGIIYLDPTDLTVPASAPSPLEQRPPCEEPPAVKQHTPERPVEKRVPVSETPERTVLFQNAEEVRTVGNSVEAPKTFHDLLMEQQEERPENINDKQASLTAARTEQHKPAVRPARPEQTGQTPKEAVPVRKPSSPNVSARPSGQRSAPVPKSEKRGDTILILAIVVAIIAIAAMIYAYTVIELPNLNLR